MSAEAILVGKISELEEELENIAFPRLCTTLARYRVIDPSLKRKLASLDDGDNLDSDVKVRYLLQQLLELVKDKSNILEKLIKAFRSLHIKKVCDDLARQLNFCEKGGLEIGSLLTEQDVPKLVEVLVTGSNLWEAIGIALQLPEYEREDCGKGGQRNVNRLTNILTSWVQGSHEGATAPTIENLIIALASEIVGLGRLAQELSKFERCEGNSSKIVKPDIEYQSVDSNVAEGKSTLLEVYIQSNGSTQYQWEKDGNPLSDGEQFSGVSSNMLYINNANEKLEGKYVCIISMHGCEYIRSEEIDLKVVYSSEKQHLISLYSVVEQDMPHDSWPPVSNSTFINLVLVTQSPISRESYFTVRGDMDDILEGKEVVEYGQIFNEYRKAALVLIEGRPGSGKTTLVHKITRDWAHDGKILQGAKMVFLLTLRLLNFSSRKDESLADLLQVFCSDIKIQKDIQNKLENTAGENACFILDGLDEYKPQDKKLSMVYQLINKECLPFAMVIVASRPVAINELKNRSSKRIEVIGFNREQIYKYVEAYPFKNVDIDKPLAHSLKEYLNWHPNVLHMCYLPVHAAMICFIFDDLKDKMPSTEAKIYEQFTISSILRQRRREVEYVKVKDMQSLDPEAKSHIDDICKLAYNMTINSQQVICKTDAQIPLSDNIQLDSATFGLLTVERTSKYYGIEDVYSFLHLTFQEFLAAFHLAQQDKETQSQLLQKHILSKEMKNVWKFFSGLCDNMVLLKKLLSENVHQSILYSIQCAFESQDAEVCDSIVGDNGIFEFSGNYFTPNDFIALGYVLSKSSKVKKLCFKDCILTLDGVSAFTFKKGQKCAHKSLEFKYSHLKDDTLKMLNTLLHQFPYLEELTLKLDGLRESGVKSLTENIVLTNLKILKVMMPLIHCAEPEMVWKLLRFGSKSLKRIEYCQSSPYSSSLKGLRHAFISEDCSKTYVCQYNSLYGMRISEDMFTRCTEVILVNCGIGDKEAEVLANALKPNILKYLILDFNKILDSGAVAIAGLLKQCGVVQEVSLQCNSICDSGGAALANALIHCSSLRKLNLQGNCLGDEGVIEFAKRCRYFPNSIAYLCNKNVTSKGMKEVLTYSNRIEIQQIVFETSWNVIISAGRDALKSGLMCGNLHEILLSDEDTLYSVEQLVDSVKSSICGLTCKLSDATIANVCNILTSLSSVKQICFDSVCDISSEKIPLLVNFLRDQNKNSNIEAVIITNTDNNSNPIHPGILGALKSCKKLHSLSLRSCKLSSENLRLLFGSSPMSALSSLDLSYNGISFEGAIVLKDILGQVHSLKLSHSNLGDEGAEQLAKGLRVASCLQELDLSYNGIHLKGIEMLCGAIIGCSGLKVLDLGGNTLRHEGTRRLSEVLSRIEIMHLDLSNCGTGVEGIKELMENMSCTAIQTLILPGNMLGSAGIAYLGEMLPKCSMLLAIDISDNGFGSHANYQKSERRIVNNRSSAENWDDEDFYVDDNDYDNFDNFDDDYGNPYCDDDNADDYGNPYCDDDNADDYGNPYGDDDNADDYGNPYGDDDYDDDYGNPYGDDNYDNDDGNPYCDDDDADSDVPDETSMQAIKKLAVGLRRCRHLQQLNISNNNLNAKDITLLMNKLTHCDKLEDLNLDNNVVESNSMYEIVKNCPHLTRLSIQNSHTDLQGINTLMKGCKEHNILQIRIFIGGSKIDNHKGHLLEGESCDRICEEFLTVYNSSDYLYVFINGHLLPKRLTIV